jgi:hypothetical protein
MYLCDKIYPPSPTLIFYGARGTLNLNLIVFCDNRYPTFPIWFTQPLALQGTISARCKIQHLPNFSKSLNSNVKINKCPIKFSLLRYPAKLKLCSKNVVFQKLIGFFCSFFSLVPFVGGYNWKD